MPEPTAPLLADALATAPHLRPLMGALYARLRALLPDTVEHYFAGWNLVSFSHDQRVLKTQICGFWPKDDHVVLLFAQGRNLPDPHKLLEGDAKHMRHVKLRTEAEVVSEAVADLIVTAAFFSDPTLKTP